MIPKVTEALESGRRVTTDQLRLGVDGIAAGSKQSTRRFHPLLTGARMGVFGWLCASVLGIAGVLLGWFFFASHGELFFNQRGAEPVPTENREIARVTASNPTPTLSQITKPKPTDNLEAYDLYLRASQLIKANSAFSARLQERDLYEAIDLLQDAVRLDPRFVRAYCAAAKGHDLLYISSETRQKRRALGDAAVENALRLQSNLPEAHLAYAYHLELGYRDHERAQVQLAIAKRDLPNSPETISLDAEINRHQGNFEKAIQELNSALILDSHDQNSILDLAYTLAITRQYAAAEQAYNRVIELAPDRHSELEKAVFATLEKSGDDSSLRTAIGALPASMADDFYVLTWRLNIALTDRDWQQVIQLSERQGNVVFAYSEVGVPAACYSILVDRLRGVAVDANPAFATAREMLNEFVPDLQGDPSAIHLDLNAMLLSQMAVVDSLLGKKTDAIVEAKHAVDMLPISRDAMDGPGLLLNLAVVYAWSNELDKAFETIAPLAKIPNGISYGDLKLSVWWDPLRKDPRFDKLLTELAPKD